MHFHFFKTVAATAFAAAIAGVEREKASGEFFFLGVGQERKKFANVRERAEENSGS